MGDFELQGQRVYLHVGGDCEIFEDHFNDRGYVWRDFGRGR